MKKNLLFAWIVGLILLITGVVLFAGDENTSKSNPSVPIKNPADKFSEQMIVDAKAIFANDAVEAEKKEALVLAPRVDLYVSTTGKKYAKGTIDDPLLTLQEAVDTAQKYKKNSVTVWLRGGTYRFDKTLQFNRADSRTPETPLLFSRYKDEKVIFSGAKPITNWVKVTDKEILSRLPESARNHVLSANLRDLKIYDYGSPKGEGSELIHNSEVMTLSRWPNQGYAYIAGLAESKSLNFRGFTGSRKGEFYFSDDHILTWEKERDIWLHGYWFWDWSEERQKVRSIDKELKLITLEKPNHHFGYRKGQWFYAYNLLCEIDQEKEWFLDRDNSILYFWPPDDRVDNSELSVLQTLIQIRGAENITFSGIDFINTRSTAIIIENSNQIHIRHSTIKNTGSWGVHITASTNSGVSHCEITQTGDGGIYLEGGDRPTLTAGSLYADHNTIYDYARINPTYKPGISLNGTRHKALLNHIYNAPHFGIFFDGNDHVIAYNEIHDVVRESNDAGAIYAGRDWTMRGNIISYNLIYNILGLKQRGANGIYMDDFFSGSKIVGNTFIKVRRSIHIGSGRDNLVDNNMFVNCSSAIKLDATGLGWRSEAKDLMMRRLNAMPYRSPLWSSRYPELSTILDKTPLAPEGNVIRNNLFINSDISEITNDAKKYIQIKENIFRQEEVNQMQIITRFRDQIRKLSLQNPPHQSSSYGQ